MADNVSVTAGSGTTIAADEVVDGTLGTVKVQYVKIMGGGLDDTTKVTASSNGLKVDPAVDLGSGTGGSRTLRTILDTASPGIITTGSQASPSSQYLSTVAAGDVAAAATDSGNPVKIGGLGKTANPTAVTDGQRVSALFDKLGKQVVVGSVRDLKDRQRTTITSSTSETTIITAVASTFLDLYGLVIANTSASACNVTIKDSTAGTTVTIIAVPAGETRGFMLSESGALKQTTVNNNWTATCSASVASIEITALYVKNL